LFAPRPFGPYLDDAPYRWGPRGANPRRMPRKNLARALRITQEDLSRLMTAVIGAGHGQGGVAVLKKLAMALGVDQSIWPDVREPLARQLISLGKHHNAFGNRRIPEGTVRRGEREVSSAG
jgi:hypothetical protein